MRDSTGEGRMSEKSLLDRSRERESDEGQLRVIPLQLPGLRLLGFVSQSGDPSVLAEARRHHYRTSAFQEAVQLPMIRSFLHPVVVAFDYKGIEKLEVFEVQLDQTLGPIEKRNEKGSRGGHTRGETKGKDAAKHVQGVCHQVKPWSRGMQILIVHATDGEKRSLWEAGKKVDDHHHHLTIVRLGHERRGRGLARGAWLGAAPQELSWGHRQENFLVLAVA